MTALSPIPNLQTLSPSAASQIFEKRVQLLVTLGAATGSDEDSRRQAAADLLAKLNPELTDRLEKI